MAYQLAIFDMDGTILDTLEGLALSLNLALVQNDCPERLVEEIRRFVGDGIVTLVKRACPEGASDELCQAVYQTMVAHYKCHAVEHTRPYEGILPLLETLRKRGVRTAVVSNKADFSVQELSRVYFPELFDCVIGERPEVQKKPAPDMVHQALEMLGIARENAIYIGDSEVDYQTAQNAHLACVLVSWGFRDRAVLEQLGPCTVVDSPAEILKWIQGNDRNSSMPANPASH